MPSTMKKVKTEYDLSTIGRQFEPGPEGDAASSFTDPPRLHISDNITSGKSPARNEEFVLYRNSQGHWFRFVGPATPELESQFDVPRENTLHKIIMVCEAADKQSVAVGRLVAVNYRPVQGKTAAELCNLLNRSAEDLRFSIQPLDFPLATVQSMPMISEQELFREEEKTRENSDSQPQGHPVKRRLRRIASVLSSCGRALCSCWR
ncbi:Hypp3666 [Branchiostoma lanceolatum]|uniref:Hypp3666 protein n=1 Tax=Branchiostoma lanceolatum TaxID=7740 RepID=A0A8K0A2W6_BRALA|nr:Hypp3666 [Branchiostoma lanceolatum]